MAEVEGVVFSILLTGAGVELGFARGITAVFGDGSGGLLIVLATAFIG
jgi:hypothetical protein